MAQNYGPKFWANISAEPKRKYRFVLNLAGIDAWVITKVNRPSFNVTESEHTFYNHKFYYPGRVEWTTVDVTLVDPVDPDMTATLSDIVAASGYTPPTDSTTLSTMSKAKSAGALGTVYITQVDSDGNDLEKWTLWNSFITEVKYGDLAYGDDELTELTVTLKYDWARVETMADGSAAVAGSGGTEFFGV